VANKIATDDCTSCGACEPECPNTAIAEGDDAYVIDAAKCDECSGKDEMACVAVCPTDCITKLEA
jgi:ferredoxin